MVENQMTLKMPAWSEFKSVTIKHVKKDFYTIDLADFEVKAQTDSGVQTLKATPKAILIKDSICSSLGLTGTFLTALLSNPSRQVPIKIVALLGRRSASVAKCGKSRART